MLSFSPSFRRDVTTPTDFSPFHSDLPARSSGTGSCR